MRRNSVQHITSRIKISESKTGVEKSDEHKKKIGASMKAAWAKRKKSN